MKLGKIKKRLAILMGIIAICPMAFAQEYVVEKQGSATVIGGTAETVEAESVEEALNYFTQEEMIALIQKEGTVIGESQVNGNIKVTLESIWADQHTYKILLSVEHVDKTAFTDDIDVSFTSGREILSKKEYEKEKILENIPEDTTPEEVIKIYATVEDWFKQFIKADGSVDMEAYTQAITNNMDNEIEETSGGTGTGSFGECNIAGTPAYKKYFLMTGSMHETLEEDMVIDLGTYEEMVLKTYDSKLDLANYLEAHKNDVLKIVPNELDEYEKSYLEKLKKLDPEAYETAYKQALADLETQPKQLLKDNGLKLQIVEGVEDYYISDIGFIDEALHINFKGNKENISSPRLYNEEGNIYSEYSSGHSYEDESGNKIREKYKVYPIKNIEELKKYKLQIAAEETLVEIKDSFIFEIKNKLATQTIKCINKKVQLNNNNQGILKNVTQTKLSLTLVFEELEKRVKTDEDLTVIFKDGSKQKISISAAEYSKDKATFIYDISEIKKEIDKVMLGDLEILSYDKVL